MNCWINKFLPYFPIVDDLGESKSMNKMLVLGSLECRNKDVNFFFVDRQNNDVSIWGKIHISGPSASNQKISIFDRKWTKYSSTLVDGNWRYTNTPTNYKGFLIGCEQYNTFEHEDNLQTVTRMIRYHEKVLSSYVSVEMFAEHISGDDSQTYNNSNYYGLSLHTVVIKGKIMFGLCIEAVNKLSRVSIDSRWGSEPLHMALGTCGYYFKCHDDPHHTLSNFIEPERIEEVLRDKIWIHQSNPQFLEMTVNQAITNGITRLANVYLMIFYRIIYDENKFTGMIDSIFDDRYWDNDINFMSLGDDIMSIVFQYALIPECLSLSG